MRRRTGAWTARYRSPGVWRSRPRLQALAPSKRPATEGRQTPGIASATRASGFSLFFLQNGRKTSRADGTRSMHDDKKIRLAFLGRFGAGDDPLAGTGTCRTPSLGHHASAAGSFEVSLMPPNKPIGRNPMPRISAGLQVLVLVASAAATGVEAQGLVTTHKLSAALANQLVGDSVAACA